MCDSLRLRRGGSASEAALADKAQSGESTAPEDNTNAITTAAAVAPRRLHYQGERLFPRFTRREEPGVEEDEGGECAR